MATLRRRRLARMTLRQRRALAWLALLGMLFQQLAMAAYVCPIDAPGGAIVVAAQTPPCHEASGADRVRCHAHCHPQAQSADHAPLPGVPAAALPTTTWLRAASWQAPVALGGAAEISARATAPPLTIQHCTFQI